MSRRTRQTIVFKYIFALNILSYVISFILLIVGGVTLPARPDMVMVGDTKVSGMTESEYTQFVIKTPQFNCIIAGITLFVTGIVLQVYLTNHNYGISEERVVPHTDRMNELAEEFNRIHAKETIKIQPPPRVTFDIV